MSYILSGVFPQQVSGGDISVKSTVKELPNSSGKVGMLDFSDKTGVQYVVNFLSESGECVGVSTNFLSGDYSPGDLNGVIKSVLQEVSSAWGLSSKMTIVSADDGINKDIIVL